MKDVDPEEIALRVDNANIQFPGQIGRLDLYRLLCHFESSERLSQRSEGLDFCPWQSLRDDFETPEIIRILLQTAIATRFMTSGQTDPIRAFAKAANAEVGILFRKTAASLSKPLIMREACNKSVKGGGKIYQEGGAKWSQSRRAFSPQGRG
jgi:hypothetical protein